MTMKIPFKGINFWETWDEEWRILWIKGNFVPDFVFNFYRSLLVPSHKRGFLVLYRVCGLPHVWIQDSPYLLSINVITFAEKVQLNLTILTTYKKFKEKRTVHLTHFLLRQGEPGTSQYIGYIEAAHRTFACKSQECLWQDWYVSIDIPYWQWLSPFCMFCSYSVTLRSMHTFTPYLSCLILSINYHYRLLLLIISHEQTHHPIMCFIKFKMFLEYF